ncbi:MAG: ribulose-phosphate 3-epimerase [Treponema sp.]|jgi:ribulose-phosphate 3-epimerase|nr:ribulose-phosphate 3-epimerase [Treponema sp.]
MKELCASLLAANHAHLGRDLKAAEREGINRFHIDVTDGHYTEDLTFGVQLIRDLRGETRAVLDAHLAVFNMPAILDTFLAAGADQITLQYESCDLPQRLLGAIGKAGQVRALSFIPATGFDRIEYFLDEADIINILGVDPGIGGQDFIPKVLNKIEQCAAAIARRGLATRIAVDGGLNRENCRSAADAGADILILGSGIFAGPSIGENIRLLKQALTQG